MFFFFHYCMLFYKGLSIKHYTAKLCVPLLRVVLSLKKEDESLLSMGGNI